MKKPSELAAEMQALQEAIDGFNRNAGTCLQSLSGARAELLAEGVRLGFSVRHMQGWLAKVPKGDAPIVDGLGLLSAGAQSFNEGLPGPQASPTDGIELDLTLPASLKR